jgi:hypothetical protein
MATEWVVDEVFFRNFIPNKFRRRFDKIKWTKLEEMIGQNYAEICNLFCS